MLARAGTPRRTPASRRRLGAEGRRAAHPSASRRVQHRPDGRRSRVTRPLGGDGSEATVLSRYGRSVATWRPDRAHHHRTSRVNSARHRATLHRSPHARLRHRCRDQLRIRWPHRQQPIRPRHPSAGIVRRHSAAPSCCSLATQSSSCWPILDGGHDVGPCADDRFRGSPTGLFPRVARAAAARAGTDFAGSVRTGAPARRPFSRNGRTHPVMGLQRFDRGRYNDS